MPTASATISAQKVSSRVAAPFVMITVLTGWLSVSVRTEVAVQQADDVLPVLAQDRAVAVPPRAGGIGDRPAAESRPPNADSIGSPMTRMTKNTSVTSTHTIGMTSSSRVIR